ncbi:MAG: SsrA-binding protein SmpB [Oligoflexia bacterium]|nr:SsrA-binding protein SmpB [Oligoflexia bacterium]
MSVKQEEESNIKVIALNKKARFQYHIIEACEAGLVLTGAEIKSVRLGQVTITESYVMPWNGELFLHGAHIAPYSHSGAREYDPTRKRKLLLHKHEIEKFTGRVEAKGLTIVPLRLYLKGGRAKLEIALAKGKDAPDKRESIKSREGKREMERALKRRSS